MLSRATSFCWLTNITSSIIYLVYGKLSSVCYLYFVSISLKFIVFSSIFTSVKLRASFEWSSDLSLFVNSKDLVMLLLLVVLLLLAPPFRVGWWFSNYVSMRGTLDEDTSLELTLPEFLIDDWWFKLFWSIFIIKKIN